MCHAVVLCAGCSSTPVIRGTVVFVAAFGSIPDEVRHRVKKTWLREPKGTFGATNTERRITAIPNLPQTYPSKTPYAKKIWFTFLGYNLICYCCS